MQNEKTMTLEEVKKVQLNILQQVHQYCEDNNIVYFLAHGTLIGAIRHNGYIPWDDDIDIAMPRPDYDRFINTFNGKIEHLQVLSYPFNKDYLYPIAKVQDLRTRVIEQTVNKYPLGVNIDIFPIDGLPQNLSKARSYLSFMRQLGFLRILKQVTWSTNRSILKNIIIGLYRFISFPLTDRFLLCLIDKKARKYPFGKTDYAGTHVLFTLLYEPVPKDAFLSTVYVTFENTMVKAPIGYDIWLRNIFGDYMQLPPIEKRVSHHAFEAYWK